jgi:hypothetical protein
MDNNLIAFAKTNRMMLKIFKDTYTPGDNIKLGHILCWSLRYSIGDSNPYESSKEALEDLEMKNIIMLPIYLTLKNNKVQLNYIENGTYIGFIYVGKNEIKKHFNVKKISQHIKNKVIKVLKEEVNKYSYYLNGNVYGFTLEDNNGNIVNSLWGILGTVNNIKNYLPSNLAANLIYF